MMISYIKGIVTFIGENNIILDNNGIGYDICMPSKDLSSIYLNDEIQVFTFLQVKEDGFSLFGFLDKNEIDLFKKLIGVSGVGPKTAIGCFSLYSSSDILFSILSDDYKNLSKVPGLGIKTAKKIILELKDKISLPDAVSAKGSEDEGLKTGEKSASLDENNKNDAILALQALGYGSSEILKALSRIKVSEDMSTESIIKSLLKLL